MARLHEPELKEQILKACSKQAIRMGMRDLSLLRLSKEIDVSSRMLIYHFGSKEELLKEATLKAQQELRHRLEQLLVKNTQKSTKNALLQLWLQGISQEMEYYFVSFFNLYADSLIEKDSRSKFIELSIQGWMKWAKDCLSDHKPKLSETDLTVILAVLRGLFLDYWATRDRRRTTQAFETFLESYTFGR